MLEIQLQDALAIVAAEQGPDKALAKCHDFLGKMLRYVVEVHGLEAAFALLTDARAALATFRRLHESQSTGSAKLSAPLNDPIDAAFVGGAIAILRKQANAQRQIANEGTVDAGVHFPGVLIRSPESACAAAQASDRDDIADLLESEGGNEP
jgi:hypothetical protein